MERSLHATPPSPQLLDALRRAGVSESTLELMDHWKALEILALIRSTTALSLAPEFELLGRRVEPERRAG